jgi:hypothetical protein
MENELSSLDNAALTALYEKHLQELSDALLSGDSWSDVQDKRRLLTQISREINKKDGGPSNPAEYPGRS